MTHISFTAKFQHC